MASYDGTPGFGHRQNLMDEPHFSQPNMTHSQSPIMAQTGAYLPGKNIQIRPDMVNPVPTTPSIHHNNTPVLLVIKNGPTLVPGNGPVSLNQQQQQKQPPHPLAANFTLEQGLRRASVINLQQEVANVRNIRRSLGSAAIMRILDLVELISSAPHEIVATLSFWTRACEAFFRPSSIMRFTGPKDMGPYHNNNNNNHNNHNNNHMDEMEQGPASIFKDARLASNLYLLNMSSAPRFFLAQVLAHSVVKHDIYLTGFRYQILNSGLIILVCRINLTFNYADGSTGTASGMCNFLMTRDLYVQQLDCRFSRFQQSMAMDSLHKSWANFQESQAGGDFYRHMAQGAECSRLSPNTGLSESAARLLQIGDVMSCLQPLIQFTKTSRIASPLQALESFVDQGSNPRNNNEIPPASPSPKTLAMDEPTVIKRKVSSTLNSPMISHETRRA